MRRMFPLWIAALAMIATVQVRAQGSAFKVACVDMDRVFNEYGKTDQAHGQLKELDEEYKAEREAMMKEYESLQKSFEALRAEAGNTLLSEEARAQKAADWEEKAVEISEFENRVRRADEMHRKRLEDRMRRSRRDIVKDIREALNVFARKEGYTIVHDSSGKTLNDLEAVLFVDSRIDITDALLNSLNKADPTAKP